MSTIHAKRESAAMRAASSLTVVRSSSAKVATNPKLRAGSDTRTTLAQSPTPRGRFARSSTLPKPSVVARRHGAGRPLRLKRAAARCASGGAFGFAPDAIVSMAEHETPDARRGPGVWRSAIGARPTPASAKRQQRRADRSYPCNGEPGRGEKPAEDEVRRQWDELTAKAHARWETLRVQLRERRLQRDTK